MEILTTITIAPGLFILDADSMACDCLAGGTTKLHIMFVFLLDFFVIIIIVPLFRYLNSIRIEMLNDLVTQMSSFFPTGGNWSKFVNQSSTINSLEDASLIIIPEETKNIWLSKGLIRGQISYTYLVYSCI